MATWKTFEHAGYSAVAVFFDADPEEGESQQWIGEFNFPIRRVCHAFFGKTIADARTEFEAGIEEYLNHIKKIPHFMPEPEGLGGVAYLIENERKSREFEFALLHFPPNLPPYFGLYLKETILMSMTSIEYNQSAVDELRVWLSASVVSDAEFHRWADRVWRQGELARTPAGLAISKSREVLA